MTNSILFTPSISRQQLLTRPTYPILQPLCSRHLQRITLTPIASNAIQPSDNNKLHITTHNVSSNSSNSPVVFIHDFMTDSRLFEPLLQQPVLNNHRISTLDMRGFGKSPDPVSTYSRAEDIDLARQVIQPEQHGRAHIVGSGLGGIEALRYALEYPQNVASLTLVNSGLVGHRWSTDRQFLNITDAQEVGRLLKSELRYSSKKVKEDAWKTVKWKKAFIEMNQTWTQVLQYEDKTIGKLLLKMAKDYRGFHFFYHDLQVEDHFEADIPLRARLGEISSPTMVMVGENDTPDFRQIAITIHEGVVNPYKEAPIVMSNAGHFVVMEQPEVVADKLIQFWNTVEQRQDSSIARFSQRGR